MGSSMASATVKTSYKVYRPPTSSSDKKKVAYYAVVIGRKRRKISKSDASEDGFIAFATNVRRVDVVKYGKRCDIGARYRDVIRNK